MAFYRRWIVVMVLCITAFLSASYPIAYSNASPVVVVYIKGEIDQGQVALVHRALDSAVKNNAQAVVVEIDTFGGLVDSATKIRDMLIESRIKTICYIKNRAWSAGALIALANQHIVIAPGGSIGAAEPIPTTEKTVAALKAEFASTATKTGRNPRVAEAMVDKSLGFDPYAKAGQILALTDYQAKDVGYADLVASSQQKLFEHYGLNGAPLQEYTQQWSERAAGWLSNPSIKSLLITVIFLSVLAEIKTAGLGIAAVIGMIAALLLFSSQWLVGVISWLEILLFIGGVVLIGMELAAPGLSVFGISGIISIFASLFLTLGANAQAVNLLAISLVLGVGIFLLIMKWLPTSKLWMKLVLKDSENTEAGFVSTKKFDHYIGLEGIVITKLRPAGVVEIAGEKIDVVSEGQYILPGTRVKVVTVSGNRIVVRPIQ